MNEIKPLTSINGEVTPSGDALLPLPDDGLLRGDGAFEVLRVYGGRPFALAEHLDRMQRSADAIELSFDRPALEGEIRELLEQMDRLDCLVRLICTRSGRRLVMTEPLIVHSPSVTLGTVTYSPTNILDRVKSLSYAANMQATRIAKSAGADEALLVRPDGIVLEAPTSTLFWVSPQGNLRTTAVEAGVLDSITRAKIIAGTEVETGEFPLEDVLEASEAFLASTTREVQPVSSVDGHEIPTGPSPRTIEAARVFAAALEDELGRTGDRADGTVPSPES
jgi:branched-chain amino acid aminotransferase